MGKKVKIFFQDYHEEGMDKIVEATEEEWQALIKPAVENNHPIDGGTVNTEMFNKLYARKEVAGKVRQITRVVPIV